MKPTKVIRPEKPPKHLTAPPLGIHRTPAAQAVLDAALQWQQCEEGWGNVDDHERADRTLYDAIRRYRETLRT